MSNGINGAFLKIIGVGSPVGEDDVGWRVIEVLSNASWLQPLIGKGLELVALDRPGASLLEHMAGIPQVIIIDAMVSGRKPGTFVRFEWPFATEAAGLWSCHGFGVGETLRLGQVLGALPGKLWVWGIEVQPAKEIPGEGRWNQDQIRKMLQPLEIELQSIVNGRNCQVRPEVSEQS